ncbi:MAG: primosome assembly protein PriA [Nocardioides sp.]|uniref:primosomal protein N' family DNA-binding protein n=1 Tax=Nocardioides sp. TaxID=35761 RepID=UPI0039E5C5FB
MTDPQSRSPGPAPAELELPGLVRDRVREGRAKAAATRARRAAEAEIAEVDPVARVLVELPLAHLDRSFDYAVPAAMAGDARPGVRVKVRFAGKDVDGFVLARTTASDHDGRLQPLRRVVSPEPVLDPAIAELSAQIARRYAGTRADVLRLAVPPRHAGTEQRPSVGSSAPPGWDPTAAERAWAGHEPATAFLRHLARGGSPRAVWHAAAGTDQPTLVAHAVAAALSSGRGAVVVVPDHRDVRRFDAALDAVLGPGHHVALTADAGPAARYRDFLAVRRGAIRVVVGTRAAAFAPVHDLGLVVCWDDGDDLFAEPRAPYPHARAVLAMRAEAAGAAALFGGFACSVEDDQLVRTGWAHRIRPTRDLARARVRVEIAGATDFELERDPLARVSRVPRQAHRLLREALTRGPVLVQTPRRGYAAALACERCRTPARCGRCQGPLRLPGAAAPPECGWCGRVEEAWSCAVCGSPGLRAPVIGEARTAEELGRAFPGTRVIASAGGGVVDRVPDTPALVVATPGAEPYAEGGYAAVLLLDTWLLLGGPGMRAEEEALRRWSNAAALVAPGGVVLAVGEPASAPLQALLRWDQPGYAAREAAARAQAHLPPASRLATLTAEAGPLDDALTVLALPASAEVLGPVQVGDERWRAVVRVPPAEGEALCQALGELQRVRSARKLEPVRVQVDPAEV